MSPPSSVSQPPKPLVLVPACNRLLGQHVFHVAGHKYIDAVRLAGCRPLIVPGSASDDIDALLDLADGVLLTGSASNVHPHRFDEEVHDAALPLDPARDDWTLPLVPRVLARGIPLFAICRGFQEANVALGGSLHQAVHELAGRRDHRSNDAAPVDVQYGPAHAVEVREGGVLDAIVRSRRIEVNSLHGQGLNRLADGVQVEASAPDGLVEAFSVPAAAGFNLALQWHPEWRAETNPVSLRLFTAFGDACRSYRQHHRNPPRDPDR